MECTDGEGGIIVGKNILIVSHTQGYLLKMQPPGEIVKAIDDFFEKRKGNRDA